MLDHRVDCTLADHRTFMVDAAHAGLRREGHELPVQIGHVDAAQAVFLLASTTMERPSGVSSARLASWATRATSSSVTPSPG